jgi:polysaccharide deacetylase family protein (PEP-CTERM system associated)
VATQLRPTPAKGPPPGGFSPRVVLSFDVEEHFRIEAGAGLGVAPDYAAHCRQRVDVMTRWLLDQLAAHGARATFFVVGQIARDNPALVRAIAEAGHEVASHSWDHQRIHRLSPAGFRDDLRRAKDALEQASGQPVLGYRAPTFSVTRETARALDVLAEEGLLYDSSIYPVRHDRYGVPGAPRAPFLARGHEHAILELPPVTLRLGRWNAPMGGGGYFRLFPLWLTRWAVRQTLRDTSPAVAMLYFHPWEFDAEQRQLPLGRVSRFRTYAGVRRTGRRLAKLLPEHHFCRAVDVARELVEARENLPSFTVSPAASERRPPASGL